MAVKQGFLAPQEIAGELGQVLAGQKPGRTGDGDITVFDTTGIALQDLAAAACALRSTPERSSMLRVNVPYRGRSGAGSSS